MYKRENQNAPIERVKNLFYRRIFIYLQLRVCKENIHAPPFKQKNFIYKTNKIFLEISKKFLENTTKVVGFLL